MRVRAIGVPATMAVWLAALAPTAVAYIGKFATVFDGGGATRLRLPTAAAVDAQGRVYVADGVHDRIAVFDADGTYLRDIDTVAEKKLRAPLGVRVDALGRVWIADTGNRRVVGLAADGDVAEQIDVPAEGAAHSADVTDVALAPDGAALWLADNDNHRILRYEFATGGWTSFGQRGESLGQLQFPFQLAFTPAGDLCVSDVINSRAQVFDARGLAVASIGDYGVEAGQLYRPGGLALDAEGLVWVADSVTGAVQVFRANGEFVAVLRDEAGQVLRFEAPLGLAFDGAGALYVTELRADRVRKVEIERAERAAAPPAARRRPTIGAGQQARTCTICHVDWLPPFSEGRASELMPLPQAAPNDPVVARSENCLSCHDGTVADSRHRVWDEHGHRTGVTPPPTMKVPANLPLIEGRVACRTCHSAHGGGMADADISKVVLLRVKNVASELCISCHADKTRGPRFGTHPTGGMPWPVPQALVDAGAKLGPNPRELTCQVCHTPHGASYDHLLVMGVSSNQLCVTCHDQMRPGMFREGGEREHPLSPLVNVEQAQAIADMNTRIGSEGQLICLSCHKLHEGHGQRFMLADELHNGQMCLRCHSQRAEMLNSPHDLRFTFPDERNRLGMTVTEGGPCSACHLFHRFAREPFPTELDRRGQCVSCHRAGQCAERKTLGGVNHPLLACGDCHNPHETRHGSFLTAKPEQLCSQCHTDQAALVGTAHDATHHAEAFCNSGRFAGDRCLSCHRPHGNEQTGLFRVTPVEGSGADGACLACHSDAAFGADTSIAARHPRAPVPAETAAFLPAAHKDGTGAGTMGCSTCHDPHATVASVRLLRATDGASADALCATCHADVRHLALTAHAPPRLAAHGFASGACRPCHAVHGDAAADAPLLWSRELTGAASSDPTDTSDRYCTGCHSASGGAPTPAIATHPDVPFFGPATRAAGALPLYAADGELNAFGRITCRTCHTPHGRAPDAAIDQTTPAVGAAAFLRRGESQSADGASDNGVSGERVGATTGNPLNTGPVLRAARLQVREFTPPNVCTNCHGAEGLWRFLYFHDPQRRTGPSSAAR